MSVCHFGTVLQHVFRCQRPARLGLTAGMAGWCSSLLVATLAVMLLADCTLAQTFSYSRGWKSGKRASSGVAGAAARTADDVLAEDLPLYRYFLEGRGEHRVSSVMISRS